MIMTGLANVQLRCGCLDSDVIVGLTNVIGSYNVGKAVGVRRWKKYVL